MNIEQIEVKIKIIDNQIKEICNNLEKLDHTRDELKIIFIRVLISTKYIQKWDLVYKSYEIENTLIKKKILLQELNKSILSLKTAIKPNINATLTDIKEINEKIQDIKISVRISLMNKIFDYINIISKLYKSSTRELIYISNIKINFICIYQSILPLKSMYNIQADSKENIDIIQLYDNFKTKSYKISDSIKYSALSMSSSDLLNKSISCLKGILLICNFMNESEESDKINKKINSWGKLLK